MSVHASRRTLSVPLPPVWLAALILCLVVFAIAVRPHLRGGQVPGDAPDALDYAYGAAALLHGSYTVQWIGPPSMGSADSNGIAHIPRYPPGYAVLLLPAVALGGVSAAVWVNFFCALLLGLLAAWLAARLWGSGAAPIGAGLGWCSLGMATWSHTVMSDLPTTTLVLVGLAILVQGRTRRSTLAAGLLAGALVWIRIPNLLLIAAGVAALSALPNRRRRSAAYLAGALIFPALLGLWQWRTYGSPLTTGYAALHLGPAGGGGVASYFGLHYVLGQPFGRSGLSWQWQWSNARLYILALLGFKFWVALPGIALVGLAGTLRAMRQPGEQGVAGRFVVAVVAIMLAIYLPYYWQAVRFMLLPATLLNLMAAITLAPWLKRLSAWAAPRLRAGAT